MTVRWLSTLVLPSLAAGILQITAIAPVLAQGPAELRGKSIVLHWIDHRTIRLVEDPKAQPRNISQSSELRLYVSDQGRVFSALDRMAGRQRAVNTSQQVSGSGDNMLQWRQEGGALVADQKFVSGARRVQINFTGGFSGCTVTVLHGKDGTATLRYRSYQDKRMYDVTNINVVSSSCSIRNGNVFGN